MIIKEDKQTFLDYLKDASNYKGNADKLFIVENKDEIISIINDANKSQIKVTVQGSRTGLTGSAIPNEGFIISTEKLNSCVVDQVNKKATIGPGIKYFELDNILKEYNLFFPPNPTETTSSIGGNVGTNASGSRTYKYGATRKWINKLKLILPDGTDFTIERGQYSIKDSIEFLNYKIPIHDIKMPSIKHAAGYFLKPDMDLIDLFIGAEGTLGIIYEIEIQLKEIPTNILGIIVFLKDSNELFNFLDLTVESHDELINPRLIEYFDKNSLQVLKKTYHELKDDYHSAVWIEQEIENSELMDEVLSHWYDKISLISSFHEDTWVAIDDKQHKEFAKFRHKLPEEVYENLTSNNSFKIGTDTAVEYKYFKDYYNELYQELDKLNLKYLVFGHIGNSHLHANIFYQNESEMNIAKDFYKRLILKTVSIGGTVSAEHGIGKIKKQYLYDMFPNDIELMKKIKKTLDPNLILGPDNLF